MARCGSTLICQHTETAARYFMARCHCWGCPDCTRYLIKKLRRMILEGEPNMMLTLTCNPAVGEDPTARAQLLARCWNILVKRIKRKTKLARLPYFVLIEATKRGEPHLHILLRAPFISQKWLSAQWQELTGAHRVDIRRIHNPSMAARYVTKYVTKAPVRFGGMKRYWRSKAWRCKAQEKPAHDWSRAHSRVLQHVEFALVLSRLRAEGYAITRCVDGSVEATKPKSGADPPLWNYGVEIVELPKRRSYAAAEASGAASSAPA